MDFIHNDKFPEGLRVLAVDDSPVCLKILEALLKKCRYGVTTTPSAELALDLLRKNKKNFDIVITDVEMGEMNGFELLKIIGLEMDIPVIMISTSGEFETIRKGVDHGACDFLVKPLSLKEIQNIWQHVIRLKKKKSTLSDLYIEKKQPAERNLKKRNNNQTRSNEDGARSNSSEEQFPNHKKTRISWADQDLHAKFVEAFYKLGDKAVPSKILAEMNVPGLDREKVASHLQKYRKILEKQSRKSDNTTAYNGTNGHIRNTFPSLLNSQFQNGMNYLSGLKSHLPGSCQLSHHCVTPIAWNNPFVNPQPRFLPSSPQHTSQFSSALSTINQNHQKIQVPDSTMQNLHTQAYASGVNAQNFSSSFKVFDPHMVSSSRLLDYNANIDSRASNSQFGETSNVLFDNNLLNDLVDIPTLGHASSSNLNTVFHNDSTLNMAPSSLSRYNEMRNMVAPTVPSTDVMESQRFDQIPLLENPLGFLETDNINDELGSYSSTDDLSAAIRPHNCRHHVLGSSGLVTSRILDVDIEHQKVDGMVCQFEEGAEYCAQSTNHTILKHQISAHKGGCGSMLFEYNSRKLISGGHD